MIIFLPMQGHLLKFKVVYMNINCRFTWLYKSKFDLIVSLSSEPKKKQY